MRFTGKVRTFIDFKGIVSIEESVTATYYIKRPSFQLRVWRMRGAILRTLKQYLGAQKHEGSFCCLNRASGRRGNLPLQERWLNPQ